MLTTTRFQLDLPERRDRVLVGDLTTAFGKLDADAANLRTDNVFDGVVEAAAYDVTSIAAEAGSPDVVVGLVSGQKRLRVWPRTAVGQEPQHTWTWTGAVLQPTRDPNTPVLAGGATFGSVRSNAGVFAYGGVVYFEPSNAVYIQWRGDLGALYVPYGNGLYTSGLTVTGGATVSQNLHVGASLYTNGLYMPTAARGDRPPYVLAQWGDGWGSWVVADQVGRSPPADVREWQTNHFSTNSDTGGNWSNQANIVLPVSGYWVLNYRGQCQTFGQSSTVSYRIMIGSQQLDAGTTGASAGATVGLRWRGFLGAGTNVMLDVRLNLEGYGGFIDGILYATFIPTWDYWVV